MPVDVFIVRTGTANLASVCAGLQRVGVTPHLTESARDVEDAQLVVLPGVGAFGAAMARLRELALTDALAERIRAGRSTLAVCLGLQLLCESSAETPGVAGLGVVPGRVTRFPNTVRVPQLGWNRLIAEAPDRLRGGEYLLPAEGYVYFANSYKLDVAPPGWHGAYAEHGVRFVGAMERGPVLACQFHPELSGAWGVELLRRWVERGTRRD